MSTHNEYKSMANAIMTRQIRNYKPVLQDCEHENKGGDTRAKSGHGARVGHKHGDRNNLISGCA